jgi:hypothetical protein
VCVRYRRSLRQGIVTFVRSPVFEFHRRALEPLPVRAHENNKTSPVGSNAAWIAGNSTSKRSLHSPVIDGLERATPFAG